MRLYYEPCNLDLELEEGKTYGVAIENPVLYRTFIENVHNQINGMEGDIYLTKKGKEIKFDKELTVVFNPFALDVNEKRVIAKLYSEMKDIANEEFYSQQKKINSEILSFLDTICTKTFYPINFSLDLDILQLLKMYSVKIDNTTNGLAEQIAFYIKLTHQILGIKVFLFIHLCDFLTNSELKSLSEMVTYEKVVMLDIETRDKKQHLDCKWWIVDFDNCIIEL